MTKPTIAIDIDNVLSESAKVFVAFSNKTFGTHLNINDYREEFKIMWDVSQEEANRRAKIFTDSKIQSTYEPLPNAGEVLSALKVSYRLVAVTSRPKLVADLTHQWLLRYYPDLFDEVVFAGFWDVPGTTDAHIPTKGGLYKSLNAEYVIDDHPKHCEAAIENGVEAILFGQYGWNESFKVSQGVVRVKDWKEVLEYFDGES